MKIIRYVLAICLLAASATAQLTTLSQTTSSTIVPGSVSCNTGGVHSTNAYIREYDPVASGIFTPIFLHGVDLGVESASGAIGFQPVIVNIYSDPTPGDLTANVTDWLLIATQSFLLGDTATTVEQLRFTAPGPPSYTPSGSDSLIVEIVTPDGQSSGSSFFIGSNNLGQSAPCYLTAAICGAPLPTSLAALGFPNQHNIIDLVFDPTSPPVPTGRPGTGGDLVLLTGANGVFDLAQSKTASATAGDALNISLLSPGGTLSGDEYLVIAQITASGSFYVNVAGTFGPVYVTTNVFAMSATYGNAPVAPIGVAPLLGAGDFRVVVLPTLLAGMEIGLQGISLAGTNAANGIYESTDHHVIDLL